MINNRTDALKSDVNLLIRKSRHKPNLENTSKYVFFPDLEGGCRGSEHAHASYPGLFARPGSASIGSGKKGEFRDWATLVPVKGIREPHEVKKKLF